MGMYHSLASSQFYSLWKHTSEYAAVSNSPGSLGYSHRFTWWEHRSEPSVYDSPNIPTGILTLYHSVGTMLQYCKPPQGILARST